MGNAERRTVGERGQVTIPKEFRERYGLDGGQQVVIHDQDGKLVIERPVTAEELAEGYRDRARRDRELAREFEDAATEATQHLGEAPGYDE